MKFLPYAAFCLSLALFAQNQPIVDQLGKLRSMADSERSTATRELAIQIRRLPLTARKRVLAEQLANLATEGDPGRSALQEVATTLAQALREQPAPKNEDAPALAYITLAQLVRYERVQASLDDPQFAEAMAKLEADEQHRQNVDFSLADLSGRNWHLKELRGKVVLVNFWATWCPPCRKEMPDLEELYQQFGQSGLVILAISDEEAAKVDPFIAGHKFSFPILLDPGRKVNELFRVEGIPKSFVYDRDGKLVSQAVDMRTRKQFLTLLAHAGLR